MNSTLSSIRRRRFARAALAGATAASIALLIGCTGRAASDTSRPTVSSGTATGATGRKVLFLGDSIAGSGAPALKAARETAGATFQSDTRRVIQAACWRK
ncbi:hypothetical protein [Rathayibacter rathayi]|uniref:SGNH/GDSL hydrolase family protein n=1 Tax=Rathayibacter rathayi TaxID=33887 RepID=A0ABD6W8J9_RATRA|nr:hypothetical protein [Rathayibacter rathayi]PPF14177.1 hypothetical protein C5C04_07805 [Rathayibacter rathayi]PPF24049.1 hypothetical protein C5C34_06750 [Rathayibacter rathayi]PPF80053.1 hypothetical protein C5C14_07185 [Rathayibacter rathayi]PPG13310.1 hypothetical protein C5C11_07180 [Rathayibacter rathayi]PPG43083.1 hypothetical protein C5C20_08985 [Rathayibacter rathayi]